MRDLTQTYRYNPFRGPAWKWDLASEIHEGKLKLGNFHDPAISAAVDYLKSDGRHLNAPIHAARDIFEQDSVARSEIEARILAGQTDEVIAQRTAVPALVVETYHDLFFDVRQYLETDWVVIKTVGMGRHVGFKNAELRQLWAFFALAGGGPVVDKLVAAHRRCAATDKQPTLSDYFRGDPCLDIGLLAYVALLVIPVEGAGGAWHREFGVRQLELQSITDAERRRDAVEQLQAEVIEIGRRALSKRGLIEPPAPQPGQDSPDRIQRSAADSLLCVLDSQP